MSMACLPSLETLPIELIYRIFDHFDGQMIVLSLRHVCKRLDAVIDTYFHRNIYKLNFDGMTKSDFVRVCHLIQPKNVISLTLSNQRTTAGQISLFLSFFLIERFTRLRSLTLLHINDQHLKHILKHAVTCPLIALDIQEKDTYKRSSTTDDLLSTIIERPDLQNLTLTLTEHGTDQIKWPTSSNIQHLTLYSCHIKYFPIIFRCFSSLQTLSIKNSDLNDYLSFHPEAPLDLVPMSQLTSLRMENMVIHINKLRSILCKIPSLTHLRLIGSIDQIDFQWEQLIQGKSPLLTQFEFFFYTTILDDDYPLVTEALVTPFRTPFWVEMKKWFVTCDQIRYFSGDDFPLNHDIQLYSLPVCTHHRQYHPDFYRMTSSTSMKMNTTTTPLAENTLTDFNLMQIAPSTLQFRHISNLQIRFDCTCSDDFVQHFPSLVDLSHVEKLTLIDEFPQDFYPNTVISFIHLLKQLSNIHSLVITVTWLDEKYISNMEYFCSLLPHHIKHLEIDVKLIDDMKIILDRLEHLSSVIFRKCNSEEHWQTDIKEWLSQRRNAIYDMEYDALHIWLDKKKSETSRQMTTGNKRFKTDQ